MARKGKKQDPKNEEPAETSKEEAATKNDIDANPDSTTDDAPKKGSKRAAASKDDTPAKRKKVVEENGVSKGRPKRATASKAEKEVKALLVSKKNVPPKKGAKKPATPRKEPAQFEVDSILGTRKRKGKIEYKIRWKGYTPSSDTWEPARNLTNCSEILDAWKAEQQNAEKTE